MENTENSERSGNDVDETFKSLKAQNTKLVESIEEQWKLQKDLLDGLKKAELTWPKATSDSKKWHDIFSTLDTKLGDLESLFKNDNEIECKDEEEEESDTEGESEKQVVGQTEMEIKKNYLFQEFQFTMKAISKMEITLKALNSWYKELDASLKDKNVPKELLEMVKQLVELYDSEQTATLKALHILYIKIHNYFENFFAQNQNFETIAELKATVTSKMEQKASEMEEKCENGIAIVNGNLDD